MSEDKTATETMVEAEDLVRLKPGAASARLAEIAEGVPEDEELVAIFNRGREFERVLVASKIKAAKSLPADESVDRELRATCALAAARVYQGFGSDGLSSLAVLSLAEKIYQWVRDET
jgi:hypothetical protein